MLNVPAFKHGNSFTELTMIKKEDAAMQQAKAFAAGPTKAYGATKRLLQETWDTGLETQMDRETRSIGALTKTADAMEGIDAFLNKRKPDFKGS